MTNGDKIRSMTDEERAHEIGRIGRNICDMVENCENDLNCYKCRLQWLRKEADEDDSGGTRD